MKVAIIGGGACGLTLANILEKNNIDYELFEKSLYGRKILASGNGKANIGNMNLNADKYNNEFGYNVVKSYHTKLLSFFKEIGLHVKVDNEGRIYPYSESSLSVLNCLVKNNKKIIENFNVLSIDKINKKYYINDIRGPFDHVVITCGSIASYIKKKQDGFYNFLNKMNLDITTIFPSLVGFKLDCDFKRLNGVRIKCCASLLRNNEILYKESGEVILKNDGISGICILNLSSIYARLEDKRDCFISLDIIPELSINISSKEELVGLVHPKLVDYLNGYKLEEINYKLHNLKFKIIDVYDYEFAQVVSGGININEINNEMRLKKDPNIFVGGEILDVDGMCGGYNLMFAFCSALKIGEILCNIK